MNNISVRIVNKSHHELPRYQTSGSAGLDLRANISSDIILAPLARAIVPTGIYISLPVGYEAQIRPRSGLAAKHGITILNTPGTIDSDYRGEICAILVNLSSEDFIIKDGERICQMVIAQHAIAELVPVDSLDDTQRGFGGLGSTGVL